MDEHDLLYRELSYQIRGIFFDVRNSYGPGHKESVYKNLTEENLTLLNIPFTREQRVNIYSDKTGKIIGTYIPDFVVDNKIIIEAKAAKFTTKADEKQLYHYLRNSEYELGFLVNFGTKQLYIKRIVYSNDRKPFLPKSA